MSVTKKVERNINKLKDGVIFQYSNLGIERLEYSAATKAIERLVKKGIIRRISAGVFYKPEQSVFGELKPREKELLKLYLFKKDKRIAYVTGTALYNRMGLTRQIPNTIKIASKVKRITTKVGEVKVKSVKSYIDVDNENYTLLEFLDALKDFSVIPDINQQSAILLLNNQLERFSRKEQSKIVEYALEYPPRVKALLGAILEFLKQDNVLDTLKINLNPLTKYKLGIKEDVLYTAQKWNIY